MACVVFSYFSLGWKSAVVQLLFIYLILIILQVQGDKLSLRCLPGCLCLVFNQKRKIRID